jgi:hypothetical protein
MKYFYDCEICLRLFRLSPALAAVSSRGNVIVIREEPTSSSSESNFTDPQSPDDTERTLRAAIVKLSQLDVIGDESLNFDGGSTERVDEMPIVKSGENGQTENGNDRGIFSVSRVKRVELSEIPLDISSAGETVKSISTREVHFSHSCVKNAQFHDLLRARGNANDLIKT